ALPPAYRSPQRSSESRRGVGMMVPASGIYLDKPDSPFHQAARAEQFRRQLALPIALLNGGRLLGDVKRICGGRLRMERQLEGPDTRLQLLIALDALHLHLIHLLHQ